MRRIFIYSVFLAIVISLAAAKWISPLALWSWAAIFPIASIGFYDLYQVKHSIN